MSDEALTVPMNIDYPGAWISWVASTTACLRALDVDCDPVDVAGMSGYAFHIAAAGGLCPSGPTALPWQELLPGAHDLGRSTAVFHPSACPPDTTPAGTEDYRRLFAAARQEIEAGRPCVVWGCTVPEFAVVVGIEGERYVLKSFKGCRGEDEPAIPFDGLACVGIAYLLSFPTGSTPRPDADRLALARAVARYRSPPVNPIYSNGAAAYDRWIEELQGRRADAGGNAYNAACYAEGRRQAAEFLRRVAARSPALDGALNGAIQDYSLAAVAMDRVAALFPFSAQFGSPVKDARAIEDASAALQTARDAEGRAIERLAGLG